MKNLHPFIKLWLAVSLVIFFVGASQLPPLHPITLKLTDLIDWGSAPSGDDDLLTYDSASGKWNSGNFNLTDGTASVKFKTAEFNSIYDNGNSGAGTVTIDWDNGQTQKLTLTGNCTIEFTNPLSGGAPGKLWLIQDGTGSRNPAWTNVEWSNGDTEPTWSTTASYWDEVVLEYDGTHYKGSAEIGWTT